VVGFTTPRRVPAADSRCFGWGWSNGACFSRFSSGFVEFDAPRPALELTGSSQFFRDEFVFVPLVFSDDPALNVASDKVV